MGEILRPTRRLTTREGGSVAGATRPPQPWVVVSEGGGQLSRIYYMA